jgi:hypothetical protein
MNKLKSLFCTTPIVIFDVKPAVEPNFGATEVVGALKEANIDTIHLDLNAMLVKYRRDINDTDTLTEVENYTLSDIKGLTNFLNDHTISPRIHKWATYLATTIKKYVNGQTIDFICYSFIYKPKLMTYNQLYDSEIVKNLKTVRAMFPLTGMYFSIILRKYLDFIPYTVPLYCGGKSVYRDLARHGVKTVTLDIEGIRYPVGTPNAEEVTEYFNYIASAIPIEYLPLYWVLEGYKLDNGLTLGAVYEFIEHIQNNLDNDKLKMVQRLNKEIEPFIDRFYIKADITNKITFTPDLQALNFKDAEIELSNSFPDDLVDQFPEFKNLKPFNYYNYRFTEGCIFKCAFCYHSTVDWLIKDEVSAVVDRLERWYDNGVEYMRFFNDNINFKVSWTKEFANEIVKRNIKIKWTDSANLKVGDRDMFQAMAAAGCVKLWYGTETASPRILKEIGKWTDGMFEKIDNTLVWAHEAGIWNGANIIVNFPHETAEEYEMVKNFLGDYYNKGIVNCFNVNWLAITNPSAMYAHPERHKIKLDRNAEMGPGLSYFGRKWEELDSNGNICNTSKGINKRGRYRLANALEYLNIPKEDLTTGDICWIFENDYLFFSLVQLYNHDILKKKEVYHYILSKYNTDKRYSGMNLFA